MRCLGVNSQPLQSHIALRIRAIWIHMVQYIRVIITLYNRSKISYMHESHLALSDMGISNTLSSDAMRMLRMARDVCEACMAILQSYRFFHLVLSIGLIIQNFIEGIQHECVVYSCGRGR